MCVIHPSPCSSQWFAGWLAQVGCIGCACNTRSIAAWVVGISVFYSFGSGCNQILFPAQTDAPVKLPTWSQPSYHECGWQ